MFLGHLSSIISVYVKNYPGGNKIMLLGIVSALSVLAAAGICVGTGAFETFNWIWVMPLGFIGAFLVLAGIAFGIFLLICSFIDLEKQRDEDSPWFRKMVLLYIRAVLTILPVRIRMQGVENVPKDGRFLLVSNHLANIDPAFLLNCFTKSQLAFVAKRETAQMFLVNKVLAKLLCPLINRENDREALKTILRCISLLKNDTVSVAIFPEGRINAYRKLAHFRPGVFKIAQKANVPVVVCTLKGTNTVIKNLLKCKGSTVDIHLLGVIPAEEVNSKNTVEVAEQVYRMMAADLGPEHVLTPEEEENA